MLGRFRQSASEFLDRVAALISPPHKHRHRYFGVLAPNSPWRAQVVVVLPPAGSRLLTRELLYTAFTRARKSLTVVGTAAALRSAVTTPVARASGLSQQLLAAAPVEAPAPGGSAGANQK